MENRGKYMSAGATKFSQLVNTGMRIQIHIVSPAFCTKEQCFSLVPHSWQRCFLFFTLFLFHKSPSLGCEYQPGLKVPDTMLAAPFFMPPSPHLRLLIRRVWGWINEPSSSRHLAILKCIRSFLMRRWSHLWPEETLGKHCKQGNHPREGYSLMHSNEDIQSPLS